MGMSRRRFIRMLPGVLLFAGAGYAARCIVRMRSSVSLCRGKGQAGVTRARLSN